MAVVSTILKVYNDVGGGATPSNDGNTLIDCAPGES